MNNVFDAFSRQDMPYITLCNPDKSELYSLGTLKNDKISLKYNTMSSFNFDFVKTVDGVDLPAYDYLESKRIVLIENIGYFQITKVTEDMDGLVPFKSVETLSLENELVSKQINSFSGTLKFYDLVDPTGTFLDLMLTGTGWSIGAIDPALYNIYRTFDISANTVYNALITTAETAFSCVFTFDTFNKLVNATALDNATFNTDIYISFNNLAKKATFAEITDEVVTALSVYGGGDLDIRAVNPLGTNTIYDFTYYQNSRWMDSDLINAITNWQNLIAANQSNYAALLTNLRIQNVILTGLQADLVTLQGDLTTLLDVKKVKIEGKLSLTQINAQIAAKKVQITNKKTTIINTKGTISSILSQVAAINSLLSFANNFTSDQLVKLNPIIIQNTYQNENIIVTDIMTPAEIQDQGQALYDLAKGVLTTVAVPHYEFTMDTANMLALPEFKPFTDQLGLGAMATIEFREDYIINTALLEINYSLLQPTANFSLVFSNRLRLDNGSFVYSDLFGQVNKMGTTVAFGNAAWANWSNQYKGPVSGFITSSLDASKNALISSSDQSIVINQNGLIGTQLVPGTTNSTGNQVWLTSSILAFSKDNFNTASLALGQITFNGQTLFGLVADAIIGNILIGSQLTISNQSNTFSVDSNGATLTNGTLTINRDDGKIQIQLNPQTGISIQNVVTNKTVFFADGNGDINFSGILTGVSGDFSGNVEMKSGTVGTATNGLKVTANGITTTSGNYLKGNGDLLWGALSIIGNTATFAGTINANKINGQINGGTQIQNGTITNAKIHDLSADKLTAGTITSIDFYGGTIKWGGTVSNPNVKMYGSDDTGLFQASNAVQLFSGTDGNVLSTLYIEQTAISLYIPGGNGTINLGLGFGETINVKGELNLANATIRVPSGNTGYNGSYLISTPSGTRTISISGGLIYNIS